MKASNQTKRELLSGQKLILAKLECELIQFSFFSGAYFKHLSAEDGKSLLIKLVQ